MECIMSTLGKIAHASAYSMYITNATSPSRPQWIISTMHKKLAVCLSMDQGFMLLITGYHGGCRNDAILITMLRHVYITTLRPRQSGPHFRHDIFECLFAKVGFVIWLKFYRSISSVGLAGRNYYSLPIDVSIARLCSLCVEARI